MVKSSGPLINVVVEPPLTEPALPIVRVLVLVVVTMPLVSVRVFATEIGELKVTPPEVLLIVRKAKDVVPVTVWAAPPAKATVRPLVVRTPVRVQLPPTTRSPPATLPRERLPASETLP